MRIYFLALATLLIVCVGCATDGTQTARGQSDLIRKGEYVAPPAAMLAGPGPMVAGPGPGVMGYPPPTLQGAQCRPNGAPMPSGNAAGYGRIRTSQLRFLGPIGMVIGWKTGDGWANNQLTAPARYNFVQGATYRLKLTGLGREGLTLYPSLQVYPARPTTEAYLAHNSIPIRLTPEDLDQIQTSNFVTKVIYLPDAKYQDLAAGVEELVSSRLPIGEDPIKVAERRGTIMAVLRVGNMDLEMPEQLGGPVSRRDANGNIIQTSYNADGDRGEHVPPAPISLLGNAATGVPGEMMMGYASRPGLPPYDPIAGTTAPKWGYPYMHVATPIGLPGPAHLPYGRPASLRSHTMRNLSQNYIPEPVSDMLIDVRHEPGYRLPDPVSHIEYTERHPIHKSGELSWPNWAGTRGAAPAPNGPPVPQGIQPIPTKP